MPSDSVSSNRKITLLASKGYYALAQEAKDARRRRMEEKQRKRQQELQEQQEIEWKAFQDAKERCLKDARLSAAIEELQYRETLHGKYSEICKGHEEEMTMYTMRVAADEARRPIALSPLATRARASESRFSSAGLYGEAAEMRMIFSSLEENDNRAVEERKRQRIEKKLEGKRKELDTRSLASFSNVLFADHLKQIRLYQKLRATEANLQHKATEMAVAHYNQRRAFHLPLLESRSSSKSQQLKVARGSQLKKSVNGDHYYVPLLCNMYGNLLDQEQTN